MCKFLGSAPSKIIQDFRSQYGEGGFRASTFALVSEINKTYTNFNPQGFQQWVESQNTMNNPNAYTIISNIEKEMMNYMTNNLKNKFGKDISEWWHEGVPEKIRVPAMERAQNDGEYHHPEKFVDLIDWSVIINHNFNLLGDVFTINAKMNDNKKKKLGWLVDVNEIRRIVAHPPRGGVSDEQLEFLNDVNDKLMLKLNN